MLNKLRRKARSAQPANAGDRQRDSVAARTGRRALLAGARSLVGLRRKGGIEAGRRRAPHRRAVGRRGRAVWRGLRRRAAGLRSARHGSQIALAIGALRARDRPAAHIAGEAPVGGEDYRAAARAFLVGRFARAGARRRRRARLSRRGGDRSAAGRPPAKGRRVPLRAR